MSEPLVVSVIIAVYNGQAYLGQAIESLLAQDYEPLEIIVVDDGSTDGTVLVARQYDSVRVIQQANRGPTIARNAGLAASRGDVIGFLDHDDLWLPNKLALQLAFLRQHRDVGYVLCYQQQFIEPGFSKPSWLKPSLLGKPLIGYQIGALLGWRWVFEQLEGFDPAYYLSSDADWFVRARDAGIKAGVLPDTLLLKRNHEANLSSQARPIARELTYILRASLQRRRETTACSPDGTHD